MSQSPPRLVVEPLVRAALLEDLGRAGDITTSAIVPGDREARGTIAARRAGAIAGTEVAELAFALVDPRVEVEHLCPDGTAVEASQEVLRLSGPAAAILTAERVALNFLCRLSGIATCTADLVRAARPHPARITCTRKTTPGLRALEKHAVRAGGGVNHRFGLDDGVLIKDNHIALAGGVRAALERVRRAVGHMVVVELEVDDLGQLEEALELGIDAVLLDNMTPAQLREAVAMVAGRAVTEASGGITAETIGEVAATGVDLISVGWLTHSAPALDLGLDIAGPAPRGTGPAQAPAR